MDEMQKSEVVIAKVLDLLMQWGIQDLELKFEELDLEADFAPHFFRCIEWLSAEGIIRTGKVQRFHDSPGAGIVMHPVLTAYGMHLLGLEKPIGGTTKAVSEAVKEVSSGHTNYARAGNFTGGLLASFIKSMG